MRNLLKKALIPFTETKREIVSKRGNILFVKRSIVVDEIDIIHDSVPSIGYKSTETAVEDDYQLITGYGVNENITTKQASEETGISISKIQKLCKKQEIEAEKVKNKWSIRVGSLNDYILRQFDDNE